MTVPARAWVTGFGSVIVPLVPFEVVRRVDDVRIMVAHHGGSGVRSILIAPDPSGGPTQMALGRDTTSLGEVVAFAEEAPFEPRWRLVTRDYSAAWPAGSTVWSTPNEVDWAFEITARGEQGDEVVYVQGPWPAHTAPTLEALIGAGMSPGQRGPLASPAGQGSWLDLHYNHQGARWVQRRLLVPLAQNTVALVTAQALATGVGGALAAASELATTLALRS